MHKKIKSKRKIKYQGVSHMERMYTVSRSVYLKTGRSQGYPRINSGGCWGESKVVTKRGEGCVLKSNNVLEGALSKPRHGQGWASQTVGSVPLYVVR